MKKHALHAFATILLLSAGATHAQLYKWVGPDGKVTYSDTPPASTVTKVETKSLTIGGVSASDFPYEVAEAMRSHPVTLYTGRNCIPCDDGRKLLNERGIPFTEKTVSSNEDIAQFRQAGGGSELPMLVVGRAKERGFQPAVWNATLSSAGYPESNRLPRNYRNPVAEAAAPRPVITAPQDATAQAEQPATRPQAMDVPPAIGNAPPGFRF